MAIKETESRNESPNERDIVYVARKAGHIAATGSTMSEVTNQILSGYVFSEEDRSATEDELEAEARARLGPPPLRLVDRD